MNNIVNFEHSIYDLENIYSNIIDKYFKFANFLKNDMLPLCL